MALKKCKDSKDHHHDHKCKLRKCSHSSDSSSSDSEATKWKKLNMSHKGQCINLWKEEKLAEAKKLYNCQKRPGYQGPTYSIRELVKKTGIYIYT